VYSFWNFVCTNTYNGVITLSVLNQKENKKMSKTQLDLQTQTSTIQIVPLLVPAEATIKHLNHQTAALTEEYSAPRSIQPPNRSIDKPKQHLNFCPTCKMLLRTTASSPSTLRCKKCGYKVTLDPAVFFDAKRSHQHGEIAVIDHEKGSLRTHPIVQAICDKCGNTESETWTIAVGSEGTVSSWVFLRCIKCGFMSREVG
jgi:DNA-directed RNA polymerase subunit M/transcription elongation factor TFIIS